VIIVLGAAATAVIGKIPPSTPTTTTLPLDVLDYGVTAQTRVDTLMFTLTIKARGAGTLHNTWQLDNRGSSQPMGSESMTFTGPIQIKEVVYSVPFSCDRGQRLEGEMRVEMTKPEPISRASYAPYDFTCH
jgi:hypothetical protein